jgi:hypothetical protein
MLTLRCGHYFSPVFKKEKEIAAGSNSGTNEGHNSHTKIS